MSTLAHEAPPAKNTPIALSAADNMPDAKKRFIGAVPDEWQLYSDDANDYTIGAPIGFGASSIVYAATYHPSSSSSTPSDNTDRQGIPCALKVLDLDSLPPRSLQLLQRETTLMSLSKHPNVLRVRGSWIEGHKLYIALRLMNKGSAADVMRYGWPGGMEEDVVRCILRQALKGLNYLHINGFIHRDIKAANLLIDDDGTVLLGDLGVAADLTEDTSHVHAPSQSSRYSITSTALLAQSRSAPLIHSDGSGKRSVLFDDAKEAGKPRLTIGKRKSFVGTPCWMAPELIQGRQYDSSADIWSFGITALELSQGRPPRSRESPQRVLLRTIQDDPPTLNRDGGAFKYSRGFKDIVDSCLNKDPSKRPTAEELLQSPFFKSAKKKSYLINTILKDLPPLVQRQERRVLPPVKSANSIDSWDFATTLNSPTTSVYRRHVLEDMVTAEDNGSHTPEVFVMEEDIHRPHNHHHHTHHHHNRASTSASSQHSRAVSWAESSDLVEESEAEAEAEVVAPVSPSTSATSLPDDGLSSSLKTNSISSSFTDASDTACRVNTSQSTPAAEPLSPIEENTPQLTVTARQPAQTQPTAHSRTPTSSTLKNPSPSSKSQQGLWKKFKTNVKRRSPSEDDVGEGSLRKEKGKVNSVFSTASKGLLSRSTSTRTSIPGTFKDGN